MRIFELSCTGVLDGSNRCRVHRRGTCDEGIERAISKYRNQSCSPLNNCRLAQISLNRLQVPSRNYSKGRTGKSIFM